MRIAIVGWTNTEFDLYILIDTMGILKNEIYKLYFDFLDLQDGRDFLKENDKYDIVVLNYIFAYRPEELDECDRMWADDTTKVSDLHTNENWRNRLLKTQAKEIMIFGLTESEVTGDYINKLNGYTMKLIELERDNKVYGRCWRYSLAD